MWISAAVALGFLIGWIAARKINFEGTGDALAVLAECLRATWANRGRSKPAMVPDAIEPQVHASAGPLD